MSWSTFWRSPDEKKFEPIPWLRRTNRITLSFGLAHLNLAPSQEAAFNTIWDQRMRGESLRASKNLIAFLETCERVP